MRSTLLAHMFSVTSAEEASKPKKKKAKTSAAAATEARKPVSGVSAADVSAWEGLGLGPGVLGAIGGLGFGEPTPIQRECLLPAIRDRRDVIGAAQTVRTCRHLLAHAPTVLEIDVVLKKDSHLLASA